MNPADFMTSDEIRTVVADLRRRGLRSVQSRMNLAVFRLSCCCGLRVGEICGLEMRDFILGGPRPTLTVRRETTKGKRKKRHVPLWWSAQTLSDLQDWLNERLAQGAGPNDPYLCAQSADLMGQRLKTDTVAKRWRTAIRVLGPDRRKQLHIHCGRHTFLSHACLNGKPLATVRDVAGHSSAVTTNVYLHAADPDNAPDLFD